LLSLHAIVIIVLHVFIVIHCTFIAQGGVFIAYHFNHCNGLLSESLYSIVTIVLGFGFVYSVFLLSLTITFCYISRIHRKSLFQPLYLVSPSSPLPLSLCSLVVFLSNPRCHSQRSCSMLSYSPSTACSFPSARPTVAASHPWFCQSFVVVSCRIAYLDCMSWLV
jgi:hypothetical protein